jgi:hypothetical protein
MGYPDVIITSVCVEYCIYNTVMDDNIHEYILTRLSGDAPEDDILFDICQQAGVKWDEARAMLEEVKGDHTPEIERRQFPVLGLVSFVFVILGIVLVLGPVFYLWSILGISGVFLDAISGSSRVNVGTVLYLIRGRCALLSWFQLPSILFTMLTGAAIIIVNIRSLGDAWKNLVYIQWWK